MVVNQDEGLAGREVGVAGEDARVPLAMRDLAYVDDRRMLEQAAAEQDLEVGDAGGQVGAGECCEGRHQHRLLDRQVRGQHRHDGLGDRRCGSGVAGRGELVDVLGQRGLPSWVDLQARGRWFEPSTAHLQKQVP
ncbi:hypothetical protein [Microbispora sp. H13382]|uniref:hypothetical protein n=1 Tax=Microbispora sp. H13382 TaxID=2729112 RepID=UPI002175FF4F|nr:hypothetical protein [Microbispora sp. H13382]